MSLLDELRRRNVIRVGVAYLVVAWLLLQITDVVAPILKLPDWFPAGVLLVLGLGFPLVLVFAWAFELTPEGLKREKEVDRSQSITPQTGQKLNRLIIAGLVLALAVVLVERVYFAGKDEPAAAVADLEKSVAVLPFVNMSGDADNEYFSDGLTETLLHMLAQLPELKVAARTSSFAFKNQQVPIGEVAQQLGVGNVLEGSVQKANNQVRVTAQLIRAEDGFHIWSQNYTRDLQDIFAIQDDIASAVAQALGESLLNQQHEPIRVVQTEDVSAYDLYLKALEQQAIYSYVSLPKAEGLFKQALAADPGFREARMGLINNFLLMFRTGMIRQEELNAEVRPMVEILRRNDPDNPDARRVELQLDMTDQTAFFSDPERAYAMVDELEALLTESPDSGVGVEWLAFLRAYYQDDKERGLAVISKALERDPLAPYLYQARGQILIADERFEEASVALERSIALNPDDPNTYGQMADVQRNLGNYLEFLKLDRKAIELDPQDHELAYRMATAFYDLKLPEEAGHWQKRVEALVPGSDFATALEMMRLYEQGQYQSARELAELVLPRGITDRHNLVPDTLLVYVQASIALGLEQEAYHYLQLRAQDVENGVIDRDLGYAANLDFYATLCMPAFASAEEMQQGVQSFAAKLDAVKFPWRNNEATLMFFEMLTGNIGDARRIGREQVFNKPLATQVDRLEFYRLPIWEPVRSDPEIHDRLQEMDREFTRLRSDVQTLIAGSSW